MPEKQPVEGLPVEVIEVNSHEAIVMMLMVLLQLIHYINLERCSC